MKYLDKLNQYPGCVYVIDGLLMSKAVGTISVDKVVDRYIQGEYYYLKNYRFMDIINPNADDFFPEIPENTTYRELK